jgi:hypothetical protein
MLATHVRVAAVRQSGRAEPVPAEMGARVPRSPTRCGHGHGSQWTTMHSRCPAHAAQVALERHSSERRVAVAAPHPSKASNTVHTGPGGFRQFGDQLVGTRRVHSRRRRHPGPLGSDPWAGGLVHHISPPAARQPVELDGRHATGARMHRLSSLVQRGRGVAPRTHDDSHLRPPGLTDVMQTTSIHNADTPIPRLSTTCSASCEPGGSPL